MDSKRSLVVMILLLVAAFPSAALSGDWRVTPIRLELGRDARSGVVTVVNESPEKLQLQMKVFEWAQDAEGKDRYTETAEILFFPRILIFEKAEEKIVRAGIRMPAAATEKTYRLFLEEIPDPRSVEGVNVAIAIRFGVPIFVRPVKEEVKGAIEKIELAGGDLRATVRNSGNVHFIVQSVAVKGTNPKGEEIFSKELAGWYLLAGAARTYTTTVPREVCADSARIAVEARTDKTTLSRDLVPNKTMCAP